MHPGAQVYLGGHSLGGALGTIASLDLTRQPRASSAPSRRLLSNSTSSKPLLSAANTTLITLGSPRLLNPTLAAAATRQLGGSWRVTHHRDIVPSLPATVMGYHHVAREVWEQAGELRVCNDSGEDMSCQSGACLFGLCTSVRDHLTYLGYSMEGGEC